MSLVPEGKRPPAWVLVIVAGVLLATVVWRGAVGPDVPDRPAEPARAAAHREPVTGVKDFRVLADAALRIRDPEARREELARVLVDWIATDPSGLGKYAMLLEVRGDTRRLDELVAALRVAMANVDPKVASSSVVQDAMRRLVTHVARTDPDAALELAGTWLDDERREAAWVDVARTLVDRDPADALALVAQMSSPMRRMQAYAVVGAAWARRDPTAVLAWASALDVPTERAMALNAVLTALAQADAQTAATTLASQERRMTDAYEDKFYRELAAAGLTEEDLSNDPDRFRQMLEAGEVPPPTSSDVELLGDSARVVGHNLALEGPAAALAWAESLDNEFVRLNAMKGVIAGWSEVDPAAAASFAADRYGAYPEVVSAAYDVWASSSPVDAALGAAAIADPDLRSVALLAIAESWAVSGPLQAAAWLDTLPPSDRSDAIVLAVASALAATHPLESWQLSATIDDPAARYRALKAAFSSLVVSDPRVASDLLAGATLDPATAARLQDMLVAAGYG